MRFVRSRNKESGFTLIELTIVMIIIGLVLAALSSVLKTYVMEKRQAELIRKTNAITSALAFYIQDESYYGDNPATGTVETDYLVIDPNGAQFPCPADPTLGPGDKDYGEEARLSSGSCDASGGVDSYGSGSDRIYFGAVPFVTLGISSEDAFDEYGYKFSYSVSKSVSDDDALKFGRKPAGAITVRKYDNTGTYSILDDVPFTIVQHGPTGRGAYSIGGEVYDSCASTSQALDGYNCDNDDVFVDAMDYRSTNMSSSSFYDDTIIVSLRGIADKEEYWAHSNDTTDVVSLNPGNVGVNVVAPMARLHVRDNTSESISATSTIDDYGTGLSSPKNYTIISDGEGDNSGGILITTGDQNDDQDALTVWNYHNDNVIFSVAAESGNVFVDNSVTANTYYYSSDMRLKENIQDLDEDTLKKLMLMRLVRYNFISRPDETRMGVIAQNLQLYFPELVSTGDDGMLKVDYVSLVVPIIKGMQEMETEHQQDMDALKKEIDALRQELSDLKNKDK